MSLVCAHHLVLLHKPRGDEMARWIDHFHDEVVQCRAYHNNARISYRGYPSKHSNIFFRLRDSRLAAATLYSVVCRFDILTHAHVRCWLRHSIAHASPVPLLNLASACVEKNISDTYMCV